MISLVSFVITAKNGNSGRKTIQNQGLKTGQCDSWTYLSGIGDKPKAIDSLNGAGVQI